MIVTRFAPSPTGYLHLGHAYSALLAHDLAHGANGRFILRIEDIDATRCRPEFEAAILEDLAWLGLSWQSDVRRQSDHMADYGHALALLDERGLLYPCFCTRKEIMAEIARAGGAPHGPEGHLYPGLCRALPADERQARMLTGEAFALRLDMSAALEQVGLLRWRERTQDNRQGSHTTATPSLFGDVVLARKETPTSYHLSVTLDDHLQGVTRVVRGEDLRPATHVQRLLQALLGLDTPEYLHHPLMTDRKGRRYAKRDKSLSLRALRQAGVTPEEIRQRVGL